MRLKGLQLSVALAMTVALAFGITAAADVGSGSGPPTSIGTGGAAASVERLATQAGIDTLRRGGNAVDIARCRPSHRSLASRSRGSVKRESQRVW